MHLDRLAAEWFEQDFTDARLVSAIKKCRQRISTSPPVVPRRYILIVEVADPDVVAAVIEYIVAGYYESATFFPDKDAGFIPGNGTVLDNRIPPVRPDANRIVIKN
jgi:hypothetical protein